MWLSERVGRVSLTRSLAGGKDIPGRRGSISKSSEAAGSLLGMGPYMTPKTKVKMVILSRRQI